MIILLKYGASKLDADEIVSQISSMGLKPLYMPGVERTVIGAIGDERVLEKLHFENHPAVERVDKILTPYKLVCRDLHPIDTVVSIDGVLIGGGHFAVIAGPCAVESEEQMFKVAEIVKKSGGNALRGGAFKPRSSPYSFQGLGIEGLKILNKVSKFTECPYRQNNS